MLLSSAVAEIHETDPESDMTVEQLDSLLVQLSNGPQPVFCPTPAVACYLYVAVVHWVAVAMNVAVAVNAAVWFGAWIWSHTWVPGKRKHPPTEGVAFGGDPLTFEMLVAFIVENWAAPAPEMRPN